MGGMQQALVIVDVQQALFETTPVPWEATQVVQRIQMPCQRARAANVPVVWVQHSNATNLVAGSAGWQLVPGLQAQQGDVGVAKPTPDAFAGTDLHAQLQARQVQQIVIAGYASEFCIDTTVRRSAALGYAVLLVADAHTTHDKPHAPAAWIRQHHNCTLAAIRSFGTPICAVESADVVWTTAKAGNRTPAGG